MYISRPKGNEKNTTRNFEGNSAENIEYNPSRRTGREVSGKMNKDELEKSMNESLQRDYYEHPITRMQSPPILTRPTIGTTYMYGNAGSRSPVHQSVIGRNQYDEGDRRTVLVTVPRRDEISVAGEGDKRRSPTRANNEILLDQPMKHFQDDNRQTYIDYGRKFEMEKNMSPNKNYDFNVSYEERKRAPELRMTKYIDADGNYVDGYDYENVEGSKTYNPKLKKGYDPINKKEGKLINRELKTLKPVDESMPERRTHFQKMKKLSAIILSKNEKNPNDEYDRTLRRTIGERKTFNPTRTTNSKFIRVTMAMLSSKGPNCEDKIITRLMRLEKGGVVDLAQQANKNKSKYEVKKVRTRSNNKSGGNIKIYNPKDRLKAAQFIQGWWRDILYRYKNVTDKIVKIQSYWRGHWLRRYVYDIFYSIIILNAFCDKIKSSMQRSARLAFYENLRDNASSDIHYGISNDPNSTTEIVKDYYRSEEEKLAYELHRTILKGLTNVYANKLRLLKVRCLYHWLVKTKVNPAIVEKTRCLSALRIMNISKLAQNNRVRKCFRMWAKIANQKMLKELAEKSGMDQNEILKKDNEFLKRDNDLLNKENDLKKKEDELIKKENEIKKREEDNKESNDKPKDEEKLIYDFHRGVLKGLTKLYGNKLRLLKVRSMYHWFIQTRPSPQLAEKTRCLSALRLMNSSKIAQNNRMRKCLRLWAKVIAKQKEEEKLTEKEKELKKEMEQREKEKEKEFQNEIEHREKMFNRDMQHKDNELKKQKTKFGANDEHEVSEKAKDKAEEEKLLNDLHRNILKGMTTLYGNKLKCLKVRSLYHWLLQIRPSPQMVEKTRYLSALRLMNVSKGAAKNRLRACLRLWSKLSAEKVIMTPNEEKDYKKADFASKILARTVKSRLRKDAKDAIGNRFNLWKKFVKSANNFPKFLNLIKAHTLRKSLSPVLMNKKLSKLKNRRLKDVISLTRNSFMRKLLHYLLLWRQNVKTNAYKNKLKSKVIDNIFKRNEKSRLLKYFLMWRFIPKSNEILTESGYIPTDENQIINTDNSIDGKKHDPKQGLKSDKQGDHNAPGSNKTKKPGRVQAGNIRAPKTKDITGQKGDPNNDIPETPLTKILNHWADEKREDLISKPISVLSEGLRAWYLYKKNKAKTVQGFCKGIIPVIDRLKIMKRSKQLHMLYHKYLKKSSLDFRSCFIRWRRINKGLNNHDMSRVIQNFVRNRRDRYARKLDKLNKINEIVKNHFKQDLIDRLKKINHAFKIRRILLRLMKDLPAEVRLEFLKRYLNRWRNVNQHMKKNHASILLVARLKGHIVRRFRDLLLRRKAKMNDLVMKLFGKYLDMRRLCFNKWMLITKRKNLVDSAKVIQKFLRDGVQNSLQNQSKDKIKEMAKKLVWKRLGAAIKKASAIADKGKGEKLKNALYYCVKKPFKRLADELTLKARMKTMNKVMNKIKVALRAYWLPYYLRKWKRNTWDYMLPLLIKLQLMIKSKLIYWRLRTQYKKSQLLSKFLQRMTNDNDLKKKIALHLWAKAAKLGQIQEKIANVQARWKGNLARKKTEKEMAKNKISNLMKKLARRKVSDNLTQVANYVLPIKNALNNMGQLEKRYSINNMFAFGRNALRNLYFFKMTNKRCYDNNLANLRLFFDKWMRFVKKMDSAVNVLQRNARKRLAIKKKHGLEKLRERLKYLFFKVASSNAQKLQMALYIWKRNARLDYMDEKIRYIQALFRFNLAKRKVERLRRYKNALDEFEKKLLGVAYRDFIRQLHKNKQLDKIRFFFLKKFHSLDDQFKKLFMKKYLDNWRQRAQRLKNQEGGASQLLTARIRGFLVRKFIKLMLARKNKLNALLLRLFIKHNSKLDVYFYLWRSINKRLKLHDSAKTIQNFVSGLMPMFQDQAKQKRYNQLSKGFEPLRSAITKAATAKPFKQLKDFSRKNGISKFFNKLADKRRNMLEKAFNKIRDEANERRALRLAAVRNIQGMYRLHKQRTGIWGLIMKIKKLRMILNMMKNRDLRYLFVAFKNWKRFAQIGHIHNQAQVIQRFLKDKVIPSITDKKNAAKNGLQKLFNDKNNKHRNDFLTGLLNIAKFMRLRLNLRKQIFNRLNKNSLDRQKMAYLAKLMKMPKTLALRVLKFWMNKWRNTARYLTEQQQKTDAISDRLKTLWLRYVSRYQDATGLFLRLWSRQANKIKLIDNASVIQNFIREKLYRLMNRNRWNRFAYGLYLKNGKLTGYEILRRLRTSKYYRDNLLALSWKDFINNLKDNRIMRLIKLIFGNFEKRKEILMKDYGFRTWLDKIARMKRKEAGCERLTKAIAQRHATNAAEVLGSVFIVKKLLALIRLIQLKGIFDKIKQKSDNINTLKNNLPVFDKCDEYLLQFNKKAFVDRLQKLYVFKRLLKMFNCIDRYNNGPLKLSLFREFFDELFKKYADKNQYNNTMGGQFKRDEIKSQPFKFNKKTTNPKKVQSSKLQRSPYKYAVPHLVNRLAKLQTNHNKAALNSIKLYVFSILMNKYSKTKSIKPFLTELRANYDYLQSIPIQKEKLRNLLKRYFNRHLLDKFKEASKISQLSYLLKLSMMNKDIAKRHFIREIIRKWKFVSIMKKVAKMKMEAMYKTMHLNYLTMANEVFGDEEHGLIKEFEAFGNSIGMFTNEDLETYDVIKKKFYKSVKKRYVFEATDIEEDKDESS
jgi:hypothetical protein